jgi:hypothetical protein
VVGVNLREEFSTFEENLKHEIGFCEVPAYLFTRTQKIPQRKPEGLRPNGGQIGKKTAILEMDWENLDLRWLSGESAQRSAHSSCSFHKLSTLIVHFFILQFSPDYKLLCSAII